MDEDTDSCHLHLRKILAVLNLGCTMHTRISCCHHSGVLTGHNSWQSIHFRYFHLDCCLWNCLIGPSRWILWVNFTPELMCALIALFTANKLMALLVAWTVLNPVAMLFQTFLSKKPNMLIGSQTAVVTVVFCPWSILQHQFLMQDVHFNCFCLSMSVSEARHLAWLYQPDANSFWSKVFRLIFQKVF